MNDGIPNVKPVEGFHYSLDDVAELYRLNQWTIRMWVEWFEISGHLSTDSCGILFTWQAVERIGVIYRLMKKKMKLNDIRKCLESGKG